MMNKYGKISVVVASLMFPFIAAVSGIIEWYFKSNNPDNVNITAGLAYIEYILGTGLILGAILWVISFGAAMLGLKKDRSKDLSKLALVLLAFVTIFSLTAGITKDKASDAEEAYQQARTQEFFDTLKKD